MEFTNIEALYAYLQSDAIPKVLQSNVANAVKEEIANSADRVVYTAYEPTTYYRRKDANRGLKDKSQMNALMTGACELTVTDDAPFNPFNTDGTYEPMGSTGQWERGKIDIGKSLAYNVENGWGFQETDYSKARRFMEDATETLRDGVAADAVRDGLTEILGAGVVTVT
jgi:hypothetical protein